MKQQRATVRRPLHLALMLILLLAACTAGGSTSTTDSEGPPQSPAPPQPASPAGKVEDPGFYVNLMWHQHQPFYPKNAEGVYTRPWVRLHATKDYYDMAALVAEYPDVHVTFNLTPVLLMQLEDLANGAKDEYWVKAEIPAEELTDDDKQFIVERFFDTNPGIIERFPRYQQLADSRAVLGNDGAVATWTAADFRDLQILFNLAWTDPGFLAIEPLSVLVAKGTQFSEADKTILFDEHRRIIAGVIPLHAQLWEEGHIEITTTPLAHPILPLISDTNLAAVGDPTAVLPSARFQEIPDADQQVIRGLDTAERLLGRRPTGMWPGEGSVAQLVMSLFSKNGVEWVASGEEVLAKSLGIGSFTRDGADTVEQPESLYRPWQATLNRNDPVPMFFRDGLLSDLVGFEYSGMSGPAAADDLMSRLAAIRDALEERGPAPDGRPPIVSIILDGENAWEHYDNDGIDFLNSLYAGLTEADWVATITPSEYLERFGEPEPLDEVWPGAWFQPNFATWIGEDEEATAWDYLAAVRADLRDAERSGDYPQADVSDAFDRMLLAEGSDWFWWYGSDQDSGNDDYFDEAFRELLGQVYDELGEPRPSFVDVPIIPQRPVAVDDQSDGAGSLADSFPGGLRWSVDREAITIFVGQNEPFEIVLGAGAGDTFARSTDGLVLGFAGTDTVRWDGLTANWCPSVDSANSDCVSIESDAGEGVEVVLPLDLLAPIESGDVIAMKIASAGRLVPEAGPVPVQVPDISNVEVALRIEDPIGDDHGPGSYTYPTDSVFTPGAYDLTLAEVGTEDDVVVVAFEIATPIQNPWDSPRGVSIQTFDLYIDVDPGAATGRRALIDGRNAALSVGNGWEYAVTIEGWEPAIYVADADGSVEETRPSFDVVVFSDKGRLVARIPAALLGDSDPTSWGIVAAVMSQEGFPSSGVRRIRDVETVAEQWRIGGGTGAVNETRILDLAWPDPGIQEISLSELPPAVADEDTNPDAFAILPEFTGS